MATNADGKGDEANDFSLPFATLLHMMTIKLSSSNYLLWKNQILPIFESQNLMKYLDGSSPPPSAAVDLQLRMLLNSSLSEEAMAVIVETKSATDAWKALETKFSASHDERPATPYLYPGSAREMSNETPVSGPKATQTYVPPPPPPPSQSQQLNLPLQDLLSDGRRRYFVDICVPLCKASIKGNWKDVKPILQSNENLVRSSITENYETVLHVAASADSTAFMVELLKMMEEEDLLLQTITGDTALCLAAAAGNVKMAEILVKKNMDLLTISGSEGLMPLSVAALYGNHDMVRYLYQKSNKMEGSEWYTSRKQWLLTKCVQSNLFDIALKIIEEHGELGQSENILRLLARKPSAFNNSKSESITSESEAMQLLKTIWNYIVDRPKAEVEKLLRGPGSLINGKLTHPSSILFVAAAKGNTEFVVELIREYPGLIWMKNDNNQSIFHFAVTYRQESIYNMLHEIGSIRDLITRLRDTERNNMLHLVGKNEEKNQSENVAGVVFQMQRELLWFKEVESMVPIQYRDENNIDGLTPRELFTKNHQKLVSKGEEWIKLIASQCMLVATLIATVVFAVAFTFPGGYNQNNGYPMFLQKGTFIAFVIMDAISFILSSTSILVFLSFLTSRYAQDDFLILLPRKLLIGLATLFLSIMTMMAAFSMSFFVLYQKKFISIPVCISILAIIPIIAFAYLNYRLLKDVFRSTRSSRFLFKPKKQLLYYQNPMF